MKKSIIALLLALVLVCCCMAALADGDNILRVYTDRVYRSFNQLIASDGNFFDAAGSWSEGLVRLDENNDPQPGLAESYTVSEDGLTYTFTLRDGLVWSNGTPLTAKDFEFGIIMEIADSDTNGYADVYAPLFKNGTAFMNGECDKSEVGVKAVDDKTLVLTLANPTPYFDRMLCLSAVFPLNEEFYNACGDQYGTSVDTILYCGPFVATEMDLNVGVTLAKNPDYWDAENVHLDGIEIKVITDSSAALNAYEAGEIDRVNLSSTDVLLYMNDPTFGTYSDFRNYYMQFDWTNTRLNLKMRQALSMAIDREELVDYVLMTGAVAAGGVVSQGITAGTAGEGKTFREVCGALSYYDPDMAKQLWDEGVAEMGGTAPTDLVMLVAEGTDFKDMATYIQEKFRTVLGIEVEINTLTQKARNEVMKTQNYDMALSAWGADYDDPMTWLELWTSTSGYRGYYAKPEYCALVDAIRTETDAAKRLDLCVQAETMLIAQDMVVTGIYDRGYSYLQKEYVSGIQTHPVGQPNEYKYVVLSK